MAKASDLRQLGHRGTIASIRFHGAVLWQFRFSLTWTIGFVQSRALLPFVAGAGASDTLLMDACNCFLHRYLVRGSFLCAPPHLWQEFRWQGFSDAARARCSFLIDTREPSTSWAAPAQVHH